MNQLFSAVAKMVLYQICNECRKKYFTFKAQFLGSLSGSTCSSIEPSRTWMGDRLEPRSKSEVQLENIIFFLHLFSVLSYI